MKAFGLEILASLEDAKHIVMGEITEMDHEAQNVQVELSKMERGVLITLLDKSGSFLEIQPEEVDENEEQAQDSGRGADECEHEDFGHVHCDTQSRELELEAELEQLTEENTGLCMDVSVLKERMEGEI